MCRQRHSAAQATYVFDKFDDICGGWRGPDHRRGEPVGRHFHNGTMQMIYHPSLLSGTNMADSANEEHMDLVEAQDPQY